MTFTDALLSHGLRPRSAVHADGRWHRCPTESHPRSKNGSYKLASDAAIGWYQDFAIDAAAVTWRPDSRTDAVAYDPRILAASRERARREMRDSIRGARVFYADCAPLIGGHEYLTSHGLDMTGCVGLRIDRRGRLIIPAHDANGEIMTIQAIAADGEKRFWPGAPVKAARFTVERRAATVTVLCEGLATGLAIFAAVPTSRVVVAFNSGNLQHVALHLGGGLTVVASDNDWETEGRIGKNPGIEAAREAAALIGCGVAIPKDILGTDYADMRQELVAARLEKAFKHERESNIRRAVDGLIASEITRNAKFITTPKRAS